MKSLNACIFLCVLALFIGCTTPGKPVYHNVTYDYDVEVDFDQIKTYNWVNMPATSRIDEFNQIRIRQAVNDNLSARGMKINVEKPDVFLVMYGGSYKAFDMLVMMDYAVYDIGRLKLAMYDSETNNELWWGETRADLFHDLTPAQKENVIEDTVTKILETYPPRP